MLDDRNSGIKVGKNALRKYLIIAVCVFLGILVIGFLLMNFPVLFLGVH